MVLTDEDYDGPHRREGDGRRGLPPATSWEGYLNRAAVALFTDVLLVPILLVTPELLLALVSSVHAPGRR